MTNAELVEILNVMHNPESAAEIERILISRAKADEAHTAGE